MLRTTRVAAIIQNILKAFFEEEILAILLYDNKIKEKEKRFCKNNSIVCNPRSFIFINDIFFGDFKY